MADPLSIPTGLLAALDAAVLERRADGLFGPLGELPPWFDGLFAPGETDASGARGGIDPSRDSDFLAHFLPGAVAVWDGTQPGRLMSGPFTEAGQDGAERTLEATAVLADGRALLLLSPPTMSYDATQRLLQTARNDRLDVERTQRRTEEREVLLHCIVHDLANPLAGLRGGLRLLDTEPLGDEDRELIEIARRQADIMRDMIRATLDTFRQEVEAMAPATATPADAADALRQSARALGPRAQTSGVALRVDAPEEVVRVVADARRLERVVMNLLENAIRHSPEGGTVRLLLEPSADHVTLAVEDEGPGVAPEARGDLFKRFSPHGPTRGQAGLGLYTCRLAAESWGGTAGYDPLQRGGARFWVRLRRARPPLAERAAGSE